jgi:predicted DNA-binding WGR domain protein
MMIALEAHAPALNRLRSWTLAADKDLFGRWQAVVTFGRIGRRGQARRHAFEDEAGLSRFERRALLRCRSATQRIGVSYEAVEASPSVLPLLMQLGVTCRFVQNRATRRASRVRCLLQTPIAFEAGSGRRFCREKSAIICVGAMLYWNEGLWISLIPLGFWLACSLEQIGR